MREHDDPGRTATLRRQMRDLLAAGTLSARELSGLLSIPEREVYSHLVHLRRSMQGSGKSLVVIPSRCRKCDFQFRKREKLKKPGRCPRCRETLISEPLFGID